MNEETTQESPGTQRVRELHQTKRKSDKQGSGINEWTAARKADEEVAADLDCLYAAREMVADIDHLCEALDNEGMDLTARRIREFASTLEKKE